MKTKPLIAVFAVAALSSGSYASSDWKVVIEEHFDNALEFTSTDPEVYISGGQVHWTIHRNEGEQYVYRTIPNLSNDMGDLRITVTGRIDNWTNNCECRAGIGDALGTGFSVTFGFIGGGCDTQGPFVRAYGVELDYSESSCVFEGNWLWIEPGVTYTATLTIEDNTANLEIPGVGVSNGIRLYGGSFAYLYVGNTGDQDWPQCSGVIESIIVESRVVPVQSSTWGQIKALYQ